ncbi:hypothetical protein JCM10213_003654 [Rhodosporidiobolus nylandii]
MADDALFDQVFGSQAGEPFDADAYLATAAPLDDATLALASGPPFANPVTASLPASHTRETSGSSGSTSTGAGSFVAPADLTRSASSSRRSSNEQYARASVSGSTGAASPASEISTSTKASGNGKKQKKNEDGDGKKKKTRNRKPSSCAACRRRKLRCNRADPCDQCTAKGEAHLCDWEGAEPLYKVRNEADAEELRNQVARLESLVRYLTSQRREDDPHEAVTSVGLEDGGGSPVGSIVQFPSKAGRQASAGQTSHPQTPQSSFAMDLRANDLCEGLAQLAIKEFVVVEGSGTDSWAPGGTRGLEFVEEATQFLDTMPQQFGVANAPAFALPSRLSAAASAASSPAGSSPVSVLSPSPLGTASFGKDAPPLSDVLKFLPDEARALSAYTYFAGYVSWYAHPVHLATFERQFNELRAALAIEDEEERAKAIDPFFIATYLGVLATGLALMPASRARRDGFGTEEDKDKTVDKWLEGAMVALTCGRFLDNPSIEAVRASVVLGTFFVFVSTGERSGAGMGLLSLVVQIALSLGLHRDPDRTPGKYTFFEAEERRRLFWSLFSLCILSSASLSRTWAVFDLNGVDTKLPLDAHDHEILDESTAMAGIAERQGKFQETPMTSLICKMKLAVLAKKMNDRAFGIHPVQYEEILALDAELREFEDSIPTRYQLRVDPTGALVRPSAHVTVTEMRACMIQISLAGEYIRLHRPWLLLAANDPRYQYSRQQALKYSKLLLAVYRSPSLNKARYGGAAFKACNSSVVLAIDNLAFPDGSEVALHRSIVNAVCKQMESQAPFSSLCRKGARIIRFLLDKEAQLSAQRDQRRQAKRLRVDETTAFPSRSLRTALDPRLVQPQFMLDRDSPYVDEALPHKAPNDYFSSVILPNGSHPRPSPLPLPRSRVNSAQLPPPPPSALPAPIDATNFVDLAGTFSFDFQLPPAMSYASPAPSNYSYPSPFGIQALPVYQQTPTYSSQPSSHATTPVYSLPPAPFQPAYPSSLDSKALDPTAPPMDQAPGVYTLPRY